MKTIVHPQFRRHERYTILVIGDNVGPLKQIAFALQHRSHTVLWAQQGRPALRTVRLEAPDLVVCEIDLPDLNGFEVCRMVKSAFLTKTPVVLVGQAGDDTSAIKAGADDTIADLSDTRYVLAKLEWIAGRFAGRRRDASQLATLNSAGSGISWPGHKLELD